MRRAAFLAFVVLAGCTSNAPRPAELYSRAAAEIRQGKLTEAHRDVIAAAAQWADPQTEWHWRFRLLEAEVVLAEGRPADARKLLAAPIPPVQHQQSLEARRRMHLANAAMKTTDFASASRLLEEASALAPADDLTLRLELDVLRGALLSQTAGGAAAEAVLRASYSSAVELKDTYNEAAVLNNLGYNRMKQFRYDEAIPYYTRALSAAEQSGATRFVSAILGNLAVCQYRLGDFDKALAYRKKAIEIQTRANAQRNLQASLGEVGNILTLQGEARQAIPYYHDALAIAREIKAPDFASLWAVNLATAYAEVHDWAAAERMNGEVRDFMSGRNNPTLEVLVQLSEAAVAVGRGQYPSAERIYRQVIASVKDDPAVLWQAHAELGGLYHRMRSESRAAVHFEAALRVIENTRAGLLQSEYKITFLNALIQFYRAYVDMLVDRGDYAKALQVAESSRARLLAEKLGLDRAQSNSTASVDYRALARATGAILVSYWLAPERSLVWVVTGDRVRLFRLPAQGQIRPLVEAWNRVIADLRDPLQMPNAAGQRLYEMLLGPAAGIVHPGSRVVLVPDGILHRLNFETLPAGDHYWIDDVTVAVAPAFSVLTQPRTSRPTRDSVLLIGNPAYRSPDFPNLPHAAEELDEIRQSLAGADFTVFAGARAQPDAFRSADPGRFSIIHFAAHAVANASSPLDSAIVLAPDARDSFKLYARDVLGLPLHARLVTISGCRSAGARSYSGEGLVGLAWAFLQAGADDVIGGLWDVSDRSTPQLMQALYSGLASGKGPPDALRAAKLTLAHSSGVYRKPFYWGPFLLYARARPWTRSAN